MIEENLDFCLSENYHRIIESITFSDELMIYEKTAIKKAIFELIKTGEL